MARRRQKVELSEVVRSVPVERNGAVLDVETARPDHGDVVIGDRHDVRVGDGQALGGREEEEPVPQDRTGEVCPVLVLLKGGPGSGQEVVRGQALVAKEREGRSMPLVGAGARHDVHDASSRPPVLRREGALDDLVLPDGILRDRRTHRADRGIVVVQAVHDDVVVAGALPVDRDPGCGKGP